MRRRRIERVGELMSGSSRGGGGRGRVRWRRQAVRTRSRSGREAVHGSGTGRRQTCQTNHTRSAHLNAPTFCCVAAARDLLGASGVKCVPACASVNAALLEQITSTFPASFADTVLGTASKHTWPRSPLTSAGLQHRRSSFPMSLSLRPRGQQTVKWQITFVRKDQKPASSFKCHH